LWGAGAHAQVGAQSNVVFTDYSPLSRSQEIVRRSFSPLAFEELMRTAASGKRMREQPLDVSRESFALYVPALPPPQGYALLVFVPPSDSPRLPSSWHGVLDRHRTILVMASKSGNEQPIWDRRIPLALLGAINVLKRYPINPERVFIGGFSGGSRVAMRIALDYPDLFHGALLNAGSDPIATPLAILPAAPLFEQFQRESKLVYVTGESDSVNLEADIASRQSMNAWCVFGTASETMFKTAHEAPSNIYLDRALKQLEAARPASSDELAACANKVAADVAAKLQDVRDRLDHGKPEEALKELRAVDQRYGGLAAPASLELYQRIKPAATSVIPNAAGTTD
jgi:pimeloyl-ACP methyl ester carboxylesterase